MQRCELLGALLVFVFSMACSACSVESLAYDKLPILEDQVLLFADDFSDPRSGWDTSQSEIDLKEYSPYGFWIVINSTNVKSWSRPHLNFADVSISVNATKVTGPDNNLFGVICRYQDEDNYYSFLIGSDGYYGITKTKDGYEQIIGRSAMDFSYDIQQGNTENEIMADCVMSNLTLYVNGIKLIDVVDEELAYGDVGIIVGIDEQPGAAILFNDFIVTNR